MFLLTFQKLQVGKSFVNWQQYVYHRDSLSSTPILTGDLKVTLIKSYHKSITQ